MNKEQIVTILRRWGVGNDVAGSTNQFREAIAREIMELGTDRYREGFEDCWNMLLESDKNRKLRICPEELKQVYKALYNAREATLKLEHAIYGDVGNERKTLG